MLLTIGYIGAGSLLFAALSLSPLDLLGFPLLISLWTAYLWVFTARSVRACSIAPRSPGRVVRIIVACVVIAIAALVASIAIGLFMVAGRAR